MKTEKNNSPFACVVVVLFFVFGFLTGSVLFPELIHVFVESIK